MTTIVMLELDFGNLRLLPPELEGKLPGGAMRVSQNISLVATSISESEVIELCEAYTRRWAVGGRSIWNTFPEYRDFYVGRFERAHLRGIEIIDLPLHEVVPGDHLASRTLTLGTRGSSLLPQGEPPVTMELTESEAVSIGTASPPMPSTSLLSHRIIFCDRFSIGQIEDKELVPGLVFLTARQIVQQTDLLEITKPKALFPGQPAQGPYVPANFTGAFVFSPSLAPHAEFASVMVGRIMAAAAILTTISGRVLSELYIHAGGYHSHRREFENWYRPFKSVTLSERHALNINFVHFQCILQLLRDTTPESLVAARDDFRLLALDTIEDSRRSGVPFLAFAQIWMAVERLLPFKGETTTQLALSLSALAPADKRAKMFADLKKSYNLRSKIVHGYDFKRESSVHSKILYMSNVFQAIFGKSLFVKKSEELKNLLNNHVLNGESKSYDVDNWPYSVSYEWN